MSVEDLLVLAELINEEPPKPPPKKYRALAYVDRCLSMVGDGIENDNWDAIAQFIAENLSGGYTVVVTDNRTEETKTLYPEDLITGET
jgi:hypothetical protein